MFPALFDTLAGTVGADDSSLCLEAPAASQCKPVVYGVARDHAAAIGLKRKTFFTWKKLGETHQDPLPYIVPAEVPAWYERLKARGAFKHRCPDSVITACSKSTSSSAAPGAITPGASDAAGGGGADKPAAEGLFRNMRHAEQQSGPRGIAVELEALEKRVAYLRGESDREFAAGNDDRGHQLRAQYDDALEKLRKLKKDSAKLLADDEEFTRRSWVEEDIAAVVPPVIEQWLQEGASFHRDSGSSLSRGEFLQKWRAVVTRVCRKLAESKFAPPLHLEAMDSAA